MINRPYWKILTGYWIRDGESLNIFDGFRNLLNVVKTIQLWSSWHWTIFNIWPILYIGDTYEHISTYMSRLKRLKWYSLYNIVYIICIKYAHFVTTIRKVNSILTGFIINLPILLTGPFDKPGHLFTVLCVSLTVVISWKDCFWSRPGILRNWANRSREFW